MSWDRPVHSLVRCFVNLSCMLCYGNTVLMDSFMFSFSYPNGEPQTPTRTPNTFGDSFQTPKLESSFFDPRVTWDTSDPYASSPELLRTPQKFGLGSSNAAKGQNGETGDYRGRVSDETDTARRIRPMKPLPSVSEDYPRTVGSAKSAASMQTPPPTSASRRKIPEFGQTDGYTQDATPGMGGHLETPSRLLGESPRMFGNFQSSPDLFQLASLDPTGSPFFPQQRLFWDHDLENTASEIPLPNNRSSFNTRQTSVATIAHHIPQLPTIDGTIDLPDFGNGFGISAAPPTDAAFFPAPFSTSPRLPVTKTEDPALFLSSPARRFGGLQLTPQTRSLRGLRQPYHHQAEESRREELLRAQASDGQRRDPFAAFPSDSEEEDDDFTPRGVRPGLTRSLTHHGLSSSSRPFSQAGGMMASTSGIRKSPSKGRSSPAKPMRPAPLTRANSTATGSLTRSSSVVLRIGRDGRAKAEMEPVNEAPTGLTDPLTGLDLDGSTTESEADPAEFSEYPVLHRAQSSFPFYDGPRPALSRSDSGSRPPSKGSYTSTVGSSHSERMSPWTGSSKGSGRATYRGSPDIKRTPKRHSSLLHSDSTYTQSSVASDFLPGEEEDSGDAQSALRQVLKERGRGPRPSTNGFGNRLSRSHTFAHLRSSPPRLGSDFDLHARHNASPTTLTDPDLATPSTDRHSNPSNGTRCVCRSMDNGGHLMIQCESCTHWLHTRCVGLERANLPSVYVCVFCAPTPSRQNRTRTSYVPTTQAPPSPLAHKSFRFR
ncbi:Zinc finger PHD-finger [Penicillium paradoxum]|uniref:Zinc finger PHD-finger n=1 Tax=Penicillium paradoxum TaxID=176176 RepID=UPI002546F03A|nr:Zinc finger PHD-finger [Penicillium paradoxum]KAJ5779948.1 Zinc finger PHD-finger [Penicillium paradoxum]